MSTNGGSSGHGITFMGALQVLFIGLKLTGHIEWPWYAVLAPSICTAILYVLLIALVIYYKMNTRY